MERIEKIIIVIAWIVPLMIVGGVLGFVIPTLTYDDAQSGLVGFLTGPIGLVFGGAIGGFIGAYRASKWKSDGK